MKYKVRHLEDNTYQVYTTRTTVFLYSRGASQTVRPTYDLN